MRELVGVERVVRDGVMDLNLICVLGVLRRPAVLTPVIVPF
jgi:hypothetical protein